MNGFLGTTMINKRLIVMGGAIAMAACAVLFVIAMLPPRVGVAKANFDRIKVGMTRADVATILGPPVYGYQECDLAPWVDFWNHDDGKDACVVEYFEDGVVDTHWLRNRETMVEKIRRWLP
jgi:hypothetical protein